MYIKHGCWKHPLYVVWARMMSRCYKPTDKRYNRYGGRGITVCVPWHNIKNFIADMFPTYVKGLQIDRIDNDQGYYPENCRWVDAYTQQQNRSHAIHLTHDGKTLCLSEWSRLLNISYGTLWDRLFVQKWSVEKTLSTPPIPYTVSLPKALSTRWAK